MTNEEFSNEFDILYNNIMSNQAPGLDEYEKSVFLTKAQEDIVKAYFSAKSNKLQEGFDDSARRQIDFSMLMRTANFDYSRELIVCSESGQPNKPSGTIYYSEDGYNITTINAESLPTEAIIAQNLKEGWYRSNLGMYYKAYAKNTFKDPIFDIRKGNKSVQLDTEKLKIMSIINESIVVNRNNKDTRLNVIALTYQDYNLAMNRPYKRPSKNTAWRLLEHSDGSLYAELIVGPTDTITKYSIRYITKPKPIILENLDGGLKIDGEENKTECELDSNLHQDILQRAVELAKATYTGKLEDIVSIGTISQTDIGAVPSRYDR